MALAAVAREEGVLKLVHPGGFVEMHRNPVAASDVMAKNPRHCVTRTDVFKFPWIVVRPESILKPGCVFYIVPYHTLHRLLRSSSCPPRRMTPALARQEVPLRRLPIMDPSSVASTIVDTGVEALCERDALTSMSLGDERPGPPKSCLKKQGRGNSQSRGRRVAFDLPANYDSHAQDRLLMSPGANCSLLGIYKFFGSTSRNFV